MSRYTYVTFAVRFRVFERCVKRLIEIQGECDPDWLLDPVNWVTFFFMWEDAPVWVAFEDKENYYSVFPFPKFGQGGLKEWNKRGFEIKIYSNTIKFFSDGKEI